MEHRVLFHSISFHVTIVHVLTEVLSSLSDCRLAAVVITDLPFIWLTQYLTYCVAFLSAYIYSRLTVLRPKWIDNPGSTQEVVTTLSLCFTYICGEYEASRRGDQLFVS